MLYEQTGPQLCAQVNSTLSYSDGFNSVLDCSVGCSIGQKKYQPMCTEALADEALAEIRNPSSPE